MSRAPLSAIALCAESAAVTAIGNDYGAEEMFARQVRAHGRPGDVLIALSTSGCSPNVLAAVDAAAETGMVSWALFGRDVAGIAIAVLFATGIVYLIRRSRGGTLTRAAPIDRVGPGK